MESRHEGIHKLIEATRYVHGDSIAAYLCYMAIRLIEIHRVLKPTGSLYLHCDHTANGYLRQLLDGVFGNGEGGKPGFRNEITWQRTITRKGNLTRGLANDADSIFRYSKSDTFAWNPDAVTIPYDLSDLDEKTKRKYTTKDKDGRLYQLTAINAPVQAPNSSLTYEVMGVVRTWRWSRERMEQEIANGRVVQTKPGNVPRQIRYLDEQKGKTLNNVWTDITALNSQALERTGYPTQKPIALAERIIKASSNPGDIVLDCFAGCAYVAVAAERLDRQWVACDINPRAWTIFKRQFNKPSLALLTCNDRTVGQQVQGNQPTATVHGPKQLPKRTSPLTDDWNNLLKVGRVKPSPAFKKASNIDRPEMLERLLKLSNYKAWCCGFANRMPDGKVRETTDNFHLDHIKPKSKGGTDRIYNRAPLCPKHNTSKGNREIDLEKLRVEIAMSREMAVESPSELIDLDWAFDRAMDIFAIEYARQHATEELLA